MKLNITPKAVEYITKKGIQEVTVIPREFIKVSGCCGGKR